MRRERTLTAWLTAIVAIGILIAGFTYTAVRTEKWESVATITLVPTPSNPDDVPDVLDSFERSGVAGTYVALLTSHDTLARAGSPGVDVKAAVVAKARAIKVATSSGDKSSVRPALGAVLAAAEREQAKLRDVWSISLLEAPTAPERATRPTGQILLATVILALLCALAAWILGGRLIARSTRFGAGDRDRPRPEVPAGPGWLAERGQRGSYPMKR
jgi:hypothetical protein